MPLWKRNLYILCTTQILSLMSFGFGLPFLPAYVQDLGITNSDELKIYSALLNFMPSIAMIIMSPIWGNLSEKYGKKRMIQRAMYCGTIILFLFSIVKTPNELIILRFAQGFFTGTIAAASSFVGTYNPKESLSYSLGLLTSANAMGYCVGPAIGGYVADFTSYRTSFLIGSIIMLIGATITTIFLKEDNKIVKENYLKIKAEKESNKKSNIFSEIKNLSNIDKGFFSMIVIQRLIKELFSSFLVLYIAELITSTKIATITGKINLYLGLASVLAGITITRFANKYKISNINNILLTLAIILCIPLFLMKNFTIFVISYVLLRYIISGIEPLLVSNSSQITKFKNSGLYFGYIATVQNIGSMLSPLLGSLVVLKYDFNYIFILYAVLLLLSIFMNINLYKKIDNLELNS